MSDWDELQIARVFGVEISWLHDIDKACDAFFKRRGMKIQSVREQIYHERRLREQKKDARLRLSLKETKSSKGIAAAQ